MNKKDFSLLKPSDPCFRTKDGQIVLLECRGLYGKKDMAIAFNQNNAISILAAPNGFGKTTLINLIDGIVALENGLERNNCSRDDSISMLDGVDYWAFSLVRFSNGGYHLITVLNLSYDNICKYCGDREEVIKNTGIFYGTPREVTLALKFFLDSELASEQREVTYTDIEICFKKQVERVTKRLAKPSIELNRIETGSSIFFDLRDNIWFSQTPDISFFKTTKIEANKMSTSDSERFLDSVLKSLLKYGNLEKGVADTIRQGNPFGSDRFLSGLLNRFREYKEKGFIQIPKQTGFFEGDDWLADASNRPFLDERSERIARLSLWSLLRYCGLYNHYSPLAFKRDALSLFRAIRNRDNRGQGMTNSFSYYFGRTLRPWNLHRIAIVNVLAKMTSIASETTEETLGKWIELIVANERFSESYEKTWARQYGPGTEIFACSFETFNPVYLDQGDWDQPIARLDGDNCPADSGSSGHGCTSYEGYEKMAINSDTPEVYHVDAYGEQLYFFFDYYRSLVAFEDTLYACAGLTVDGSSIESVQLVKPGVPDDEPLTLQQLSSGERAILSIAAGCTYIRGENYRLASLDDVNRNVASVRIPLKTFEYVLLDEPENSLHISWQEELLNSLDSQTTDSPMQIIVATHSPSIIAGHSNCLSEELIDE